MVRDRKEGGNIEDSQIGRNGHVLSLSLAMLYMKPLPSWHSAVKLTLAEAQASGILLGLCCGL